MNKPKHLLGIKDLNTEEIKEIFALTQSFKEVLGRKIKKVPTLRDKVIANVFFESSTRTRLSFELAEKRLSADVLNFSAATSALTKGESLLDTIQNIQHMKVDMLVVRHAHAGVPHFLSQKVHASIINAGDGQHEHPTQALLDAFSIQEKLGALKNKRVLILGDMMHSRVALSNILCLLKLGAKVRLCGPNTLIPMHIHALGALTVYHHMQEALAWAEVVYVLRLQTERGAKVYLPSIREYVMQYGLTQARLKKVGHPLLIMHPGPLNRGVEIESAIADDTKHTIILEQVENGMAIRMAVLYWVAERHK